MLAVILLGITGVLLRYLITLGANQWGPFPWGTLIVNVMGCFLIGFLYTQDLRISEGWRAALFIGFLGALTTFSSFALDTLRFVEKDLYLSATLNVVSNNCLGLGGCFLGFYLGKTYFSSGA